MSGPKFASLTAGHDKGDERPCSVRRTRISLHLDFLQSNGQHKNAASKTAKPPAQPAALPSSPLTCRILGRHPLGRRTMQLLRPILPLKKADARPDRKRISVARRLFCDFASSALSSVEKRGPDGSSGPSLTQRAFWGRAATTPIDAGGSESATRQCCV